MQLSLAHDIASALAYCHALTPQPLLHHDIKTANVLLFSEDGAGWRRLTAKLSDFGMAVGVSGTATAAITAGTRAHAAGGTLVRRSTLQPHTQTASVAAAMAGAALSAHFCSFS